MQKLCRSSYIKENNNKLLLYKTCGWPITPKERPSQVADCLAAPLRDGAFDAVLSIAVPWTRTNASPTPPFGLPGAPVTRSQAKSFGGKAWIKASEHILVYVKASVEVGI